MKTLFTCLLFILLVGPAFAAEPNTEDEKTLYALGLAIAQNLEIFSLSPAELAFVQEGLADGVAGKKPVVTLDAYSPKIQALASARQKVQGEKAAEAGKALIEHAAKEEGAAKTDSGLVYLSLKEGDGISPTAKDTVRVHYRGALPNGKEFDSSYKRGQPAEFPLSGVIPCWTEGVAKMKVGGKAKLTCPPSIAYGERGAGASIPPNATLTFEVELLDVKKAP